LDELLARHSPTRAKRQQQQERFAFASGMNRDELPSHQEAEIA
jgi:hypothetical protein